MGIWDSRSIWAYRAYTPDGIGMGNLVAEFAHMNELQVCHNMPEAIGKWTWQQGY